MNKDTMFEDWFAVIPNVEGEECWPGRLSVDPHKGMSLEIVKFWNSEPSGIFNTTHSDNKLFKGDVIKGYLDYQRPTTLLKSFVSVVDLGESSCYSRIMRDRYQITVNGILKNIHLNDEDKVIEAELLVQSNRKTISSLKHPASRFLTQHETAISLKDIFLKWQKIDKDTLYFMGFITSVEMRDDDTNIIHIFVSLIGCLEKFDKNKSGGNKTLLKRLERLVKPYHDDGFREIPDLKKLKIYRNYEPHGDGASIEIGMVKKMYEFSNFLCALGRYHILKDLGFSTENISKAFRRKLSLYGKFSILDEP